MTSESSEAARPANRHVLTAVERQRAQLDKLLKDPLKPAYVPPPPKDKTIRPAREMMKNVQGSSAGAGSGEFHVYKASRRREYERLNLLEEAARKEAEIAEYEAKKREQEAVADAKTAKNRAKRQKKKERAKSNKKPSTDPAGTASSSSEVPFKKRRLINGKELVFRTQGDEEEEEEEEEESEPQRAASPVETVVVGVVEEPKITIHEDD